MLVSLLRVSGEYNYDGRNWRHGIAQYVRGRARNSFDVCNNSRLFFSDKLESHATMSLFDETYRLFGTVCSNSGNVRPSIVVSAQCATEVEQALYDLVHKDRPVTFALETDEVKVATLTLSVSPAQSLLHVFGYDLPAGLTFPARQRTWKQHAL